MEISNIRLVRDPQDARKELLIGLTDDQLVLDDHLISAVADNLMLFPHVVNCIAGNIAVSKCIEDESALLNTARMVRNELISAMANIANKGEIS